MNRINSDQNYNKLWSERVIPLVEQWNENGQEWKSIEVMQREMVALMLLNRDVCRSGFLHFFCQWGKEACEYALRSFEKIKTNCQQETDQVAGIHLQFCAEAFLNAYGIVTPYFEANERIEKEVVSPYEKTKLIALDHLYRKYNANLNFFAYHFYWEKESC